MTLSEWKEVFKERGLRWTLPREMVLDVLSKTPGHLSGEDIYLSIHQKCTNVGIATVYRTLELLTDIGIVHKFEFGDGRSRYELVGDRTKEHHHHLVCVKCGKIINYSEFIDEEKAFIERLEKELSEKYNFQIDYHEIYFYGLCQDCK
ncbi:MAG: Fur family transcriptional regulator [bacterium]